MKERWIERNKDNEFEVYTWIDGNKTLIGKFGHERFAKEFAAMPKLRGAIRDTMNACLLLGAMVPE